MTFQCVKAKLQRFQDYRVLLRIAWATVIVTTLFYSPSCLGQKAAKEPSGLPSQADTCPVPTYLRHLEENGGTILLMLNVEQENCEYQVL